MQGMVERSWKDWPLGRIFVAVPLLVVVFLTAVLALGARQYLLYRQCHQAVAAADRLLFRFTAIKDHVDESLFLAEEINLRAFSEELQELGTEAEHLAGNLLVPEHIKAILPSRVELVGLEVSLRAVREQRRDRASEAAGLVRSLGNLNLGLQRFRFQLGDHTQSVLLGLHKIIAGSLGLIVALTCTLLFLLNQRLAGPILNLCRLAAPADEPEEQSNRCSLRLLSDRLQTLLAEGRSPPSQVERGHDGDPDQLRRRARQYRHAVTGWLGASVASELTNRLNGVINYTQALMDLDGQEGPGSMREDIQRRLVAEERKIAELIGALQQVGQWQSGHGSGVPLRTLFGVLILLLDPSFRAEGITLTLVGASHCEPMLAAGDLLLVLVTLLQQGRMAVNRLAAGKAGSKVLRLTCSASGPDNLHTFRLGNSVGAWDESGADTIWPSQRFCANLLQAHGASLHVETVVQETVLRIDVTCRNAAA